MSFNNQWDIPKERSYFFVATIENDVLIHAGISKIIKGSSRNSKTCLLLPEHPRLKNKLEAYYHYFDQVIILPYYSTKKRILECFKTCRYFLSEFRQVEIPHASVFFMFGIYDLPGMLIYNEIKERYRDKRIKRILISAFENEETYPENAEIVYISSIVHSLYSLLFSHTLFKVLKTKNSNCTGLKYYPTRWHFQLCLQGSKKARAQSMNNIMELPYPVEFLNDSRKTDLLEENSILIFVTSLISVNKSSHQELYWGKINHLVRFLRSHYESAIYIKNHPGIRYGHRLEWIDDKEVKNIDKELSAEEIYLTNKDKIKAVFGRGSTALITASWLGIKSFNVNRYLDLGVSKATSERLDNFMSIGLDIENIQTLDEIKIPSFNIDKDKNTRLEEVQQKIWEQVIQRIENEDGE